jgi:hypothetical protein
MSQTKGQTFRYRFGNETKTFCFRFQISLIENTMFRFDPESALLGLIERISFDNTNSGKNSIFFLFHCYLISERLCVERLLLYCFDITISITKKGQANLQKTEVNELNVADLEQADDGPGVPVPEDE